MAQLSLYMDDIAMEELRADAEAAGKSISSYAREVLEKRHEAERGWVNGWPPGYFELFGSCLLYTSPSPRDPKTSRMPSSA